MEVGGWSWGVRQAGNGGFWMGSERKVAKSSERQAVKG